MGVYFRLAVVLLIFAQLLLGCANNDSSSLPIDTPPTQQGPTKTVAGIALGGAVGAAVGAVSSGVSVPAAALMGGIAGGALAQSLVTDKSPQEQLQERLKRDYVQVIRVGEDYMLVLPSSDYFYGNSAHFNEKMYPAMADIAQFINQFDVATIKVAGYTNNQGNEYRNLALSKTQAQIILVELWRNHVRPSFMYSIGYGSSYPIAYNSDKNGQLINNRVQITFRLLTPKS